MFWLATSTTVAALMAVTMIFIRLKASKKPASVKKIILPPLFMSTGALMFLFPVFRVNLLQVFEAVLVGIIFSVFLIKTSKFEIKDRYIYLIPSKSFIFILFGLLLVRIMIKLSIGATISFGEMSGMFFLLAFGMIVSWRLAMLYKFKKLEKKLEYPEP
ncbi:Membrane protein CcdC involved in cytochrome C biogenesis [Lentibacillus halodurans]|uniref:Membrane protein CcdC involved in cytochrome C biogenesis n=1 Tax=Lentibacillus halodurans TaxID=237679 RepID=A0A1I0VH20_9BACI|nr:cytochrome c biogenesis protein CcdC [Lentibacillus halodurans]SFA75611.1 Membrane protein CcdC involved in cytochrome C biogenesis [Lentibacillus halodurans]